ncbi:hypothetical protein NL676_032824 [Syzygium grande]|nr:hypothetical protein NL676_032824 [Syzygium grande]
MGYVIHPRVVNIASLPTLNANPPPLCPPPHPTRLPPPPPPAMYSPAPLDLEITVISAKHLKNVNWRNGDLKPYASFSLDHDPHLRLSTRPDDSGSTRPVWNEILTIPLPSAAASPRDATLTVEVFHSKPSETPKPLVGSSRFALSQLIDSDGDAPRVYSLDLYRPSGRPQGKLRVKLAVRERPRPPPAAAAASVSRLCPGGSR